MEYENEISFQIRVVSQKRNLVENPNQEYGTESSLISYLRVDNMDTTTANCQFCSRTFVGKEQIVRGTIKNHERYCIRNPANGAKPVRVEVEAPGGLGDGSKDIQQPSTLEELERKLSGQDSSLILYECGSCKSRFSTLGGLKQHVTHCINSPVKKAPVQKDRTPSSEVTKTFSFTEAETLQTSKSRKSINEDHVDVAAQKTKRETKKLQAALQQRAATVASEVLQGKLQAKKKGTSKFQCEHCDESFLGKQSLESHIKTCKQRNTSEISAGNVQPFIAKIQQPQSEGQEPQDMIGLFIPIGMFPNSEQQLSGLPDMAAVTEMMQKQKGGDSIASTDSVEGAPTESIKEVMKKLPKNLKCEDCNKTFPPDSSIEDIEKHDCGQQTPQKVALADGNRTETIVLDEVQCKYCLRTVNHKMDLIKHYRFCLGLKGTGKSVNEGETKEDDSVYTLFSDEMRDEHEEPPVTPRRSARKRQQETAKEAEREMKTEVKRRRGRVYGKQEMGEEKEEESVDKDAGNRPQEERSVVLEKQFDELQEEVPKEPETASEATIVVTPDTSEQTPQVRQKVTRTKPPKGIVVEPKEEKTKWKTIYVVPPICPYCKMQFRAYSSLKMHYRFCFYRKKVELEGAEPSMPVLPREKDGVLYMWPEEAARLFYTKCNFCHKRFASERTRIRHMHTCSKRRAKVDEDADTNVSLADLKPTDKVRCTGCGTVTERSVFSQHLRGCRKHTKIHKQQSLKNADGIMMDENIKEGEDFLKEVTEEEKEGFLEKFGLLSKDSPPTAKAETKGMRTRGRQKQEHQEELEEGEIVKKTRFSSQGSPVKKPEIEKHKTPSGKQEKPKDTKSKIRFDAAVQEADMYMNRNDEQQMAGVPSGSEQGRKKVTQSVKIFHRGESVPDPKKAENYHCPDCGVLVKSQDGLRAHKLFCDQVASSLQAGEEKVEGSNFKVPNKLTTDIMPDCIYHCGYCGGILKEGPQFKEHVMNCYEEIGQQNVAQNHDALLKEIQNYPEYNAKKEKIPQLMVLTSKQITDRANQTKVNTQPFLMFECTVCSKILNTQTMAAKHGNACQKSASKKERQEAKRELRREQESQRAESEKRRSIEQTLAKKCEEMGYIYECYDCGRRFVSKVNVSRHMPHCVGVRGINPNRRDRDNSVPGDITCKFCQRGFLNVGAMRSHLRYCYYRDLETRENVQPKTKIVVDGSGQATEYLETVGAVEPEHEIEVQMECEEGEVHQPQQGEEEITFMVQVQRDDEDQQAEDPRQHEEIIVEAVDLQEGEVTPQVVSQLQQTPKYVGAGSYQYGESEQPVRAVMKPGARNKLTCPRCDKEFSNAGGFVTHQRFCKEGSTEQQQEQEEEEEEVVQEKVEMSPNQVSLCMDCGMIIQTEHGLLNHQKFCKQLSEAAKNVPQNREASRKVIVRASATVSQQEAEVSAKPVSPRRSPRTATAQPATTVVVPAGTESVQQEGAAPILLRKVVKRKVFNQ